MSSWSEGYVNNVTYTHGYYPNLNPRQMTIPFLMARLPVPKVAHACELGFGQGVSLNVHAAAGRARWYATDFNPAHALFAQNLADKADPEKLLIADQGFNEFCRRDDLPEFDFIGLHGIWSWISEENRRIIADFVRRKLKLGGVLYVSYNTLPGWSAHAPMRHLLLQYNRYAAGVHSQEENTAKAIAETEQVLELSHALRHNAPHILERTQNLAGQDRNYLAHEYLNQDWQPMYFADIEKSLAEAKLSFACSARYLDDFDECLYDDAQRQLVAQTQNPSLRQTVKDFLLNTQFRSDFWIKGRYLLNDEELRREWAKLSVMLLKPRADIRRQITNHRTIELSAELLDPLLDILQDYRCHNVGDLGVRLAGAMNFGQLTNLIALLASLEDLATVQDEDTIAAVTESAQKLNLELLARSSTHHNPIVHLASPVTGGAYAFWRIEQLFLLAHSRGIAQEQWVAHVWDILKNLGQVMVRNGEPLQNEADNLAELEQIKTQFAAFKYAQALRLGIVAA